MITEQPITEPTEVTLESQPTAVVRHAGVRTHDVAALFDGGYTAIAASGAKLAGPAFAVYRGDPATVFDLELGFPVAEPLAAPGPGEVTVEPSTLPAGRALAVSHVGTYDELGRAWGGLAGAAQQRGLQPTEWLEVYVTEPSPDMDPATLRTDLFLMLPD